MAKHLAACILTSLVLPLSSAQATFTSSDPMDGAASRYAHCLTDARQRLDDNQVTAPELISQSHEACLEESEALLWIANWIGPDAPNSDLRARVQYGIDRYARAQGLIVTLQQREELRARFARIAGSNEEILATLEAAAIEVRAN